MLLSVEVAKHERGFAYKRRDYARYLGPGTHTLWGFGWSVKVLSVRTPTLEDADLDLFARDEAVRNDLEVVELAQHERALVWIDERLRLVQGGGRAAYWKALGEVRVERVDSRKVRFDHGELEAILALPGVRGALLDEVVVGPGCVGLLLIDEKVHSELAPGRYAFWRGVARSRVEVVDKREQVLDVAGQELLTKDKVGIRMNVVATFQVVAPRRWLEASTDPRSGLYRDVQLALRASVGARTLDEILMAKETVGAEVQATLLPRAEAAGVVVGSVGVKDVILPGEVRALMNQVLEAEKRAQANLITRREETAATRSLLNTARLYAENPALLRLKELETAERIAEKVAELRVGGGDELVARLLPGHRDLATKDAPPAGPASS